MTEIVQFNGTGRYIMLQLDLPDELHDRIQAVGIMDEVEFTEDEPVELDDEWLIVKGTQACYVGTGNEHQYENAEKLHDGMVQWEGRFAVQPWVPRNPEIDGPLPEEE